MFQPNYKNISDAAQNIKPARIPLYEHNISTKIMEALLNKPIEKYFTSDLDRYFSEYNNFFKVMGYDTVTFEACVVDVLPFGGALAHPQPGYIDCTEKFDSYPFDTVKNIYIEKFEQQFDALCRNLPDGMKAIGGVGNGIFEIAQDLVGYEALCIIKYEDEELYANIFNKVGDLLCEIWEWFLSKYKDFYCVCRFGDDLGYKSNTMLSHDDIREHIIPQYTRIIKLIHDCDRPFLLHSCGCIFAVMQDMIDIAKIDGKHSNEDQIAPMSEWVQKYGDRIANFGGIDTDHLVRMDASELKNLVSDIYRLADNKNGGFAIGSGNSIPDYVDPVRYKIMIDQVRQLRGDYI